MISFEEKASLCAINRIFGFDPKTAQALISHLGSGNEVFRLSEKDISLILGPYSKYKGRINKGAVEYSADELHRLSSKGISFYGFCEEGYPPLLRECADAPVGIYIRSNTPADRLWTSRKNISVVGTRDLSSYGKTWCHKIVETMAGSSDKPVIISGLALGTDIQAHKTALECGLPTIAVMATGPESVYPGRHHDFAEKMAHTPGCALITDYPPGTSPLPYHFLRRNRIIAGASCATILVESKIKGGGLMTCRLAFSYDRDVYALPGRIDDIRSQGCNELIRKGIAEPLTSVPLLLERLGMRPARATADDITDIATDNLTRVILSTIREEEGLSMEDLAKRAGTEYRETAEAVSRLEIEGYITVDLFQRCRINPKFM